MDEDTTSVDALRAEVALLREQLAAAEAHLAEERSRSQILLAVVENSPAAISVKDLSRRILFVNPVVERNLRTSRDALVGKTEDELFGAEVVAEWIESDRTVVESGRSLSVENSAPMQDGEHTFVSLKFPLRDAQGQIFAIGAILTDITERKRAEAERIALQQEMIEAQQVALRELSTPLVPIADGVVAMPLVGAIDSARAQQIMEALLEGISERQAETAILDITGVTVVDTQVASALLRAAQAAQLLGARIVLTGIGAEVAQALVHLGADLSRITTLANLQEGIAYALSGER